MGGLPRCEAVIEDSEPAFLCIWPPLTKRSKDDLEISFIQANWKRKRTWRTKKAGYHRQIWKEKPISPTFHWPEHYYMVLFNERVDGKCSLVGCQGRKGNQLSKH